MKMMKRTLAMLLALVMIVGVLPMSVLADEYGTGTGDFTSSNKPVDALFVMSDLHLTTSSSTNTTKLSLLSNVLNQFKKVANEKGVTISTVNSAGDMFSSNESVGGYKLSDISYDPECFAWRKGKLCLV